MYYTTSYKKCYLKNEKSPTFDTPTVWVDCRNVDDRIAQFRFRVLHLSPAFSVDSPDPNRITFLLRICVIRAEHNANRGISAGFKHSRYTAKQVKAI